MTAGQTAGQAADRAAGRRPHGHVIPLPNGDRMRCGGPGRCQVCRDEQAVLDTAVRAEQDADRARAQAELSAVYSERAHLLAYLAAAHPGRAWLAPSDPAAPGWPVLTIETDAGQMCWHISPDDAGLLPDLPSRGVPEFDGHTTAGKYERLQELAGRPAGCADGAAG